ncbi:MAG: hypothetical protein WC465_04665 [Patescibacteria group bacterium]
MKVGHSAVIYVIIFVVLAGFFFLFYDKGSSQNKILLQTLSCQSDKIDKSVLDLDGRTSLIGAFISFKQVPISQDTRQHLAKLDIKIDENSWIFDYARAEIPTRSLCGLVKDDNIISVFIPKLN